MIGSSLHIVILGLSISSSWGNGHAATYRGLVRALYRRGHRVDFLERDMPWYRENRDLPAPEFCELALYENLDELRARMQEKISAADLVILGSYVPEGVAVGEWVLDNARGVTAFYDIDTPVTLEKLRREDYEYLHPALIPDFDIYLSFTGGATLEFIEQVYGSPRARPLYCAADTDEYTPNKRAERWLMGYLGTFSADRQPSVEQLMLKPAAALSAKQFIVAGPDYPEQIDWPDNIARAQHIAPPEHADFYNSQRFTLNITRRAMIQAGYSPSVRLFEAAACATPVISDVWDGIDTFFEPDRDILLATSTREVVDYLKHISPRAAQQIGLSARARVLEAHTPEHRALELESYVEEASSPAQR